MMLHLCLGLSNPLCSSVIQFGGDSLYRQSEVREMPLLGDDNDLTHFKCSTPDETAISMDRFSQAVKRTTSSSVLKLTD